MDHIQIPSDREPLDIAVPYVVQDAHKYDGNGFDTFPIRCGLDPIDLAKDKTPDEVMSFAQAWLFFRTLQEVFGSAYHQEDFIQAGEGSELHRIDTSKLPTTIAKKHTSMLADPVAELGVRVGPDTAVVFYILKVAHCVLLHLLKLERKDASHRHASILLSIAILLESLQELSSALPPFEIEYYHDEEETDDLCGTTSSSAQPLRDVGLALAVAFIRRRQRFS